MYFQRNKSQLILSKIKTHVQTARETHDLNMAFVHKQFCLANLMLEWLITPCTQINKPLVVAHMAKS